MSRKVALRVTALFSGVGSAVAAAVSWQVDHDVTDSKSFSYALNGFPDGYADVLGAEAGAKAAQGWTVLAWILFAAFLAAVIASIAVKDEAGPPLQPLTAPPIYDPSGPPRTPGATGVQQTIDAPNPDSRPSQHAAYPPRAAHSELPPEPHTPGIA